ncbi:MAG: hypothetical protein HQ509_10115 [Candidatus Marinimicrobia bacterium]|nr:hypothetical protein [Candidatus Neomarinimicrobiota bacterium]
MKNILLVFLSFFFLLIITCSDTTSETHALIGEWEHLNTVWDFYVSSKIYQTAPDYNRPIGGEILINGHSSKELKYFSRISGWGEPLYIEIELLENPFMTDSDTTLTLLDNYGSKSGKYQVSESDRYLADSVAFEYNDSTGVLFLPPTLFISENTENDTLTISGSVTVELIELIPSEGELVFKHYDDTPYKRIIKWKFLDGDVLCVQYDTSDNSNEYCGEWETSDDTLSINIDEKEVRYFYSIVRDTLQLYSEPVSEGWLSLVEAAGGLVDNSLDSAWWVYNPRYIEK